jgi:hypothetical protein
MALYVKNTVLSQLYLAFHSRDIFQTPYPSLNAHALKLEQVCLGSANSKGHFNIKTMYFLSSILTTIRGMSVIFQNYHSLHMSYNWYKFGCDQ